MAKNVRFDGKSTHYEVLPSSLGVRRNNIVLIEIAVQNYTLKKRGEKRERGVPEISLTAPKYVGAPTPKTYQWMSGTVVKGNIKYMLSLPGFECNHVRDICTI